MITTLRLQQFRSYHDTQFSFTDGVNVIAGPNASGKTNILEGILVAVAGKSYRAKDQELIENTQEWARIDASGANFNRVVRLVNEGGRTKKSFEINGKHLSRLTYKQKIPVVVFEPNHLLMLNGSPELRRAFLDDIIEQIDPNHTAIVHNYKRALLQRNRLLKNTSPQDINNQLFVWNIRLSEIGAQLVAARHKMLKQINASINQVYEGLAQSKNQIDVIYSNPTPVESYASYMLKKLEKDHELDRLRGFTGTGPHREDVLLMIDQKPLVQRASRGEARTTLLALKTIEMMMLESAHTTKPILLLDDVFSELDGVRRGALTKFITKNQTFITTTDADSIRVKNKNDHTTLITLNSKE